MNFIFWCSVIFTLVVPLVIGIGFKDPSTSWVAALCGAFVTFIAKFDALAELSLGPVKARMKEQIAEAAATLEQLREVATATSRATLTDLMAGGFMGSMSLKKRFELHDNIISSLKKIGAGAEQIEQAETEWKKGVSVIYHRAIKKCVELREEPSQVNIYAPEPNKKAGQEIQDLLEFESWSTPTPHQIKTVLKKYEISVTSADEWLNDYQHFLNTNEIRRKEGFIKQ